MTAHAIRKDVQGLRAIAVLSVIVFHAFENAIPGGFIGVDIFFVISGFVITQSLMRNEDAGNYSVAAFYRQRIRRIFPALYAMVAATLVAAAFILSPRDFIQLGKTALATGLFFSNLVFYKISGYFDGGSSLKPLLHTWSLAVEEQFYIVFPPLFIWLRRNFRGKERILLAALGTLSFIASAWEVQHDQTAAFFLSPFRAYELIIGCCVALGGLTHPGESAKLRSRWLAAAGLVAIIAPMGFYSGGTPFPGIAALLPAFGTAAIIFSGGISASTTSRFLSASILQFFGGLSYSLYLWHWPVLALTRNVFGTELSAAAGILGLFCSVLLAYGSFRWLESPFLQDSRRTLPYLRLGSTGIAILSVVSIVIIAGGGFSKRFNDDANLAFAASSDSNLERSSCHGAGELPYAKNCVFGAKGVEPSIAVWGDSRGAELVVALGQRLQKLDGSAMEITASACPPSVDYKISSICAEHNNATLKALIADKRIKTVILAANFSRYADIQPREMLDGFRKSVIALRGAEKRVVLVYPIPVFNFEPPAIVGLRKAYGQDVQHIGIEKSAYMETNRDAIAMLDALAAAPQDRVDPAKFLCDTTFCSAYAPEWGVLYFDPTHLTVHGAATLIQDLKLP